MAPATAPAMASTTLPATKTCPWPTSIPPPPTQCLRRRAACALRLRPCWLRAAAASTRPPSRHPRRMMCLPTSWRLHPSPRRPLPRAPLPGPWTSLIRLRLRPDPLPSLLRPTSHRGVAPPRPRRRISRRSSSSSGSPHAPGHHRHASIRRQCRRRAKRCRSPRGCRAAPTRLVGAADAPPLIGVVPPLHLATCAIGGGSRRKAPPTPLSRGGCDSRQRSGCPAAASAAAAAARCYGWLGVPAVARAQSHLRHIAAHGDGDGDRHARGGRHERTSLRRRPGQTPAEAPDADAAAVCSGAAWSQACHVNPPPGHAVYDLNGNQLKATASGLMPLAAAASAGGDGHP